MSLSIARRAPGRSYPIVSVVVSPVSLAANSEISRPCIAPEIEFVALSTGNVSIRRRAFSAGSSSVRFVVSPSGS
jgi:hypothetical protein